MLTIEKLLQHPNMRDTELLAGQEGMRRPVEWACYVDILDDLSKVQAQELVVTTGYGLGKIGWEAERVIAMLLKGQASSLALQLGRYLHELPLVILAEANKLAFPVLAIPDYCSSRQILSVFSESSIEPRIEEYGHLAIFELATSVNVQDRKLLVNKVLGPLFHYDKNNGTKLILTLQEFLLDDCNINRTAENMKLHRHTIRYRLQKIEALTGQKMRDYHARLNFQLAIFLLELHEY